MNPQDTTLSSWVRSHRVSWEMAPLRIADHGTVRAVGYEVTLSAGVPDLTPGCPTCQDTFARLEGLAKAVLPNARDRPTVCRLVPFDGCLHLRVGAQRLEPEVQLEVEVEHKHDYFAEIDDCQARCGREIQEGLRRLGAVPAGAGR